jgi:hypothetical protein
MTKKHSTRTTSDFFAKYKNPRWQKKRLEVMNASGYECESCGDKDSTLNVHHKYYVNGRDPWEYDLNELECLCASCHAQAHEAERNLKVAINQWKLCGFFDPSVLSGFISGLMCINKCANYDMYKPTSFEWFTGFMKAYDLGGLPDNVIAERIDVATGFIQDGFISEENLLRSIFGEVTSHAG